MDRDRMRLCVACDAPSPGPAKRLYYQHRDFGPFFPILEEQRRKSNNFLFSAGRALVCTGCANHLVRQWSSYEQKWTPLQRRTYTLLSDEREARKIKTNGISSQLSHQSSAENTPRFRHAVKKVSSQSKILQVFNTENLNHDSLSLHDGSFITEDTSPFRRAVKQVTKQNTRVLNESSKIADVLETVVNQHRYNKQHDDNQPSNEIVSVLDNDRLPAKRSALALMSIPDADLRSKVREELQENIEVMIRKLAEIQHVENMRRHEQELQDAAQRICCAQDREEDIKRMSMNLKRQLQDELVFRDTSRVLRDSEPHKVVQSANASIQTQTTEPVASSRTMETVAAAKKVGNEWKGKVKKSRSKKDVYASQRKDTPLRTHSETLPREIIKDTFPQPRSAQNLDAVMKELENEREWRKKAEISMNRQREMIEDLRKGIQGDVQRLIEEQNHRYQELKDTLAARETKNTIRGQTRSEPRTERPSFTGHREKRSTNRRQERDDISNVNDSYHNDDITDDDDDDDDDDSHDEDSSPARTPEYYIQ